MIVDRDVYPDESVVRAKLMAWQQWRNGDAGSVSSRIKAFSEITAATRDLQRDVFRLPIATADAELSDRAIRRLMSEAEQQWLALSCYHFFSTSVTAIARHARVHHRKVDCLLIYGHEHFILFRSQLTTRPAPALA